MMLEAKCNSVTFVRLTLALLSCVCLISLVACGRQESSTDERVSTANDPLSQTISQNKAFEKPAAKSTTPESENQLPTIAGGVFLTDSSKLAPEQDGWESEQIADSIGDVLKLIATAATEHEAAGSITPMGFAAGFQVAYDTTPIPIVYECPSLTVRRASRDADDALETSDSVSVFLQGLLPKRVGDDWPSVLLKMVSVQIGRTKLRLMFAVSPRFVALRKYRSGFLRGAAVGQSPRLHH